MLTLTKDNYKIYAAHYYDNPFCLSEDEFESDLFKSSVIKRLITNYDTKGQVNIKLLVNTVISFYNVFNHRAASYIIGFKLPEQHYHHINAVLEYLNFPLISNSNEDINKELLDLIKNSYND